MLLTPSPTSTVATQNPLLPPGQFVKYNATNQDPRAPGPSPDEQGIGQIKQSFTKGDGAYYQVVWNPGNMCPKSALYHEDQLCALDSQQAQELMASLQAGQPADTGTPGANFDQPTLPPQALPPLLQGVGSFQGSGDQNTPSLTQTG
jgi:hypothetical protein